MQITVRRRILRHTRCAQNDLVERRVTSLGHCRNLFLADGVSRRAKVGNNLIPRLIQMTDNHASPALWLSAAAAVSFRLPDDGATGVFQNNSKTEIAATSADGRASVWGMRWGKVTGSVSIRITAAKGATRAGTIATQIISLDATGGGPSISSNRRAEKVHIGGGSKKWLWIAVAGAAGGGLAAYEMTKNGSSASAAAATAVNTTISSPQVTIGPH